MPLGNLRRPGLPPGGRQGATYRYTLCECYEQGWVVAVPAVSAQSIWLDHQPTDSFFAPSDVPGPTRGAVRAFLHREDSRPDPQRRIMRVAPRLYWKADDSYLIDGRLYPPLLERIGEAYAGPHAAAVGWFAANRVGWSTQIAVRFTFAVPGEPRCRNPIDGVTLVGRRNLRRRELNNIEATYLEATATFDRWADEFLEVVDWGDEPGRWQTSLDRARRRLRMHLKSGGQVPAPDPLLYAAAAEHAPRRRLFSERIEEVAAMIASVTAKTKGTANSGKLTTTPPLGNSAGRRWADPTGR